MMIKRNFEEEAFDKVPDAMDRYDLIKIHKEEIEMEAHKIGEKIAEDLLKSKKEQYQLEILTQVQEEDIRKEGLKVSDSSDLISETYTIKATPHRDCGADTQSDFSADRAEILQAY